MKKILLKDPELVCIGDDTPLFGFTTKPRAYYYQILIPASEVDKILPTKIKKAKRVKSLEIVVGD